MLVTLVHGGQGPGARRPLRAARCPCAALPHTHAICGSRSHGFFRSRVAAVVMASGSEDGGGDPDREPLASEGGPPSLLGDLHAPAQGDQAVGAEVGEQADPSPTTRPGPVPDDGGVSDPLFLVAIVATCSGRESLLENRSLASIAAQRRPPDLLLVVSDGGDLEEIREIVRRVASPSKLRAVVIPNTRTPGASGSWNTGVDAIFNVRGEDIFEQLQLARPPPSSVLLAFLDDDDAWESMHLSVCAKAAAADASHLVVSGIVRHKSDEDLVGHRSRPITPESFRAEDFLGGNPGLQGSNLVIRLDLLLRAGGFNEALPSCTDRDLLVRICDLGIECVPDGGASFFGDGGGRGVGIFDLGIECVQAGNGGGPAEGHLIEEGGVASLPGSGLEGGGVGSAFAGGSSALSRSFDHAAPSTGDPACVRVSLLGGHTVHHFADEGRPRLSNRVGDAKARGLQVFWNVSTPLTLGTVSLRGAMEGGASSFRRRAPLKQGI